MFRRDVDAVSAVIIWPIVDGDGVSDVEIRSGALPIGQPSLAVVEVEDVGTVAEFGLQRGGTDGCRSADVDVLGTLHDFFDGIVFSVAGVKRRRIVTAGEVRIQLDVDRGSGGRGRVWEMPYNHAGLLLR